jgi:nucleoside-specific outer membrane channel protein Tsx
MRTSLPRRLSTAAAVLAAGLIGLAATPARAQQPGFATANVQVLNAWNMDDPLSGNNPTKGDQTVVTFNYFGTWDYGDVNFFVDFNRARGHFEERFPGDPNAGEDSRVYGEIAPRFALGKMVGLKAPVLGIFRDLGPAFELNQGNNFYAYLAGIGGDFALPRPYVAGVNVYYRYDKFVRHGWQATFYWGVPFKVGPVPFALAGFADFAEGEDTDGSSGLDLMTQPQLLVDVGSFAGKPGRLWAGAEWWVHRNPVRDTQALQAMLQWTLR